MFAAIGPADAPQMQKNQSMVGINLGKRISRNTQLQYLRHEESRSPQISAALSAKSQKNAEYFCCYAVRNSAFASCGSHRTVLYVFALLARQVAMTGFNL